MGPNHTAHLGASFLHHSLYIRAKDAEPSLLNTLSNTELELNVLPSRLYLTQMVPRKAIKHLVGLAPLYGLRRSGASI